MHTIFVTVEGGVAEVDARTVPTDVEVRVLDFDSLKENPSAFAAELDETDRQYLDDRHPRQFTKVTDALAGGDPDERCLDCGAVLEPDHECAEDEVFDEDGLGEDLEDDEEELDQEEDTNEDGGLD